MKVESYILVYAVRYALGRQSGAVLDVVQAVIENIDEIEEKYKGVILKDVLSYLTEIKDSPYQWEDIVISWKSLAKALYAKLSDETKEWLVNPLGGGISIEMVNAL